MDFVKVTELMLKNGSVEVYPEFLVKKTNDLMIRGNKFYAIWDEEKKLWSTDYFEAIDMIDKEINAHITMHKEDTLSNCRIVPKWLWQHSNGYILKWKQYCEKALVDNFVPLDERIIFANQPIKKEDYASKRLEYSLEDGSIDSWNGIVDVLYTPEEKHKIEWCIGAVVNGASKNLQKFLVFYGAPGTGKSTILNIIQMLFKGYYAVFDAEALGSASDTFALEQFASNPLVAICHDGDLSKIERNTRLNSLISHETMVVNEKHKGLYSMRFNSFCFIGSNKYVKITDAKSGLLRRLIDVHPTGNKIPIKEYNRLMESVKFELGHIAKHCKDVFEENPNYYDDYVPIKMMGESNTFFNFIEDCYYIFKADDCTTLKAAWEMYKLYVEDSKVQYAMNKMAFKAELMNYFRNFDERAHIGEEWIRSYYSGFKYELFDSQQQNKKPEKKVELPYSRLGLKEQHSILDDYCMDLPAQYASEAGTPNYAWDNVKTKLKDIDTHKQHYLKLPENHIVIDFDLKDENGNKCLELNEKITAEKGFPATYAETSRSGGGLHLHYIWDGDPTELSRIYDENIEIKVFTGKSSLRRKLILCNNLPIAHISTGLPLREKKMGASFSNIANEKALRTIIKKNLNKEYFPNTKPSVDFIFNALEDAYNSGLNYDVSDLKPIVISFCASSTNQSNYCLSLVNKMHFKSENTSEFSDTQKEIVFFDVEVFPNLFLVNWKKKSQTGVNRMINPKPADIERLMQYRLVGFNNRNYDNHMLYARLLGYSENELYLLSQNIIKNGKGKFNEAFNISYTDIYDYASKKQSLKKWEIELGIIHMELGLPWDQPVPEEMWEKVAEYCDNDVISTQAVWDATQGDFTAREILAELAGMSVNDTTNSLTTRIIFGNNREPKLNYVDLSQTFPGYVFEKKWNNDTNKYELHNWYMDTDLGFGGYVYSEPGMYGNVALLDVASLHPTSLIEMNYLGDYTQNFADIKLTRIYIKHKEYDNARKLFGGKLSKYLDDPSTAKQLSQALKIAINSVYGLTSAKFKNPFKDDRNENNIVALRGALFMRTLQKEVEERGFKVVHIKTDSIKIADATLEIINFCYDFAKRYGYSFEHEATYDRICLVNDAVYIAKYSTQEQCEALYGKKYVESSKETCAHNKEEGGKWTATGTQFQVPYVFKTCFSKEPIEFRDLCETKEVKTAMYLNMNENIPDENDYKFIGRVGLFTPILPGYGGGELVKDQPKKDGTIGKDSVTGAKGWRWLEASTVKETNSYDHINKEYYNKLVNNAIDSINEFGNYEWFVSDDPYEQPVYVNGHPDYDATKCIPF